ncbi:MAG: hypothetical protein Q7R89_00795 [bacterium]|nr:hypothetical protein [bacterium]
MKKKQLLALIISLSLIGVLSPVSLTHALTAELPFGGIVSSQLPCKCSGTIRIRFNPLYLGGPVVTSGAMIYSPFSTLLYANLNIGVPGKWHMGSYLPGVQACWVLVPWGDCLRLPAIGLMTKVGTN